MIITYEKQQQIPSSDIYDAIIEIKAVPLIMVACSWPQLILKCTKWN
jgi:hypothetical protein